MLNSPPLPLPPGYAVHNDILCRVSQSSDGGVEFHKVCYGWFTVEQHLWGFGGGAHCLFVGVCRGKLFQDTLSAGIFVSPGRLLAKMAGHMCIAINRREASNYVKALQLFVIDTLPMIDWAGAKPPLELIALHEGAHAVMAWHHGGSVGPLAATARDHYVFTGGVYGPADAQVDLAGPAAEEEWLRRRGFDAMTCPLMPYQR